MTGEPDAKRPGEQRLATDPATLPPEAGLVFIGTLHSPWGPGNCPRNLARAREAGAQGCEARLLPPYRAGLAGLEPGQPLWLIYWLGQARRDLIVQAPRHKDGTAGVFGLRSPVRPNPLGLGLVRVTALDAAQGRIGLDALDCFDGTPLVDIKPHIASIDTPPRF